MGIEKSSCQLKDGSLNIYPGKGAIDVPLVEEGKQNFQLEDNDAVQTDYITALVLSVSIVGGLTSLVML
jgi:hypothetical protein